MFISELLNNPMDAVRALLVMLPGMLFSLSLHECAHGYIAYRCGDDTARLKGRLTLNPLKHFDPIGFLCMLVIGFGWAKPVPVNPLHYRNYRRDDLKVSLAGITANLCLFFLCFVIMMSIFTAALNSFPHYESPYQYYLSKDKADSFTIEYNGETYFENDKLTIDSENLFSFATGLYYYQSGSEKQTVYNTIIEPAFGGIVAILYEMLSYCMLINLTLAVFNLIPIPPLDGYHVLNDLVLKQDLFAQMRTARICGGILMALILIGNYYPQYDVISIVIGGVRTYACDNMAKLAEVIVKAMGMI